MDSGDALSLDLVFDGLQRLTSMDGSDGWGANGRDLGERTFTYDGISRLARAEGPWEKPHGNDDPEEWAFLYDPMGNLREQQNVNDPNGYARVWEYADSPGTGDHFRPRFLTKFTEYWGGSVHQTDTITARDEAGNPTTINSKSLTWSAELRLTDTPAGTDVTYDLFGAKREEDHGSGVVDVYVGDDFIYDGTYATKYFSVNGIRIATRATSYTPATAFHDHPAFWLVLRPLGYGFGGAAGVVVLFAIAGLPLTVRRRTPAWAYASVGAVLSSSLVLLPAAPVQAAAQNRGLHSDALLIYGTDHLGSVRVVLDETGAIIEARDYAPFGGSTEHVKTGGYALRHQFTGQEWKEADELYDYGARYFNPRWGRFISPDEVVESFDSQRVNPHTYVRNSPQTLTDPSGNCAFCEFELVGTPGPPSFTNFAEGAHAVWWPRRDWVLDELFPDNRRRMRTHLQDSTVENILTGVDFTFRLVVFDYREPLGGSFVLEAATLLPPLRGVKLLRSARRAAQLASGATRGAITQRAATREAKATGGDSNEPASDQPDESAWARWHQGPKAANVRNTKSWRGYTDEVDSGVAR